MISYYKYLSWKLEYDGNDFWKKLEFEDMLSNLRIGLL